MSGLDLRFINNVMNENNWYAEDTVKLGLNNYKKFKLDFNKENNSLRFYREGWNSFPITFADASKEIVLAFIKICKTEVISLMNEIFRTIDCYDRTEVYKYSIGKFTIHLNVAGGQYVSLVYDGSRLVDDAVLTGTVHMVILQYLGILIQYSSEYEDYSKEIEKFTGEITYSKFLVMLDRMEGLKNHHHVKVCLVNESDVRLTHHSIETVCVTNSEGMNIYITLDKNKYTVEKLNGDLINSESEESEGDECYVYLPNGKLLGRLNGMSFNKASGVLYLDIYV